MTLLNRRWKRVIILHERIIRDYELRDMHIFIKYFLNNLENEMILDSEKDYNKFIEHVQLSLKTSPVLKYYQMKRTFFLTDQIK